MFGNEYEGFFMKVCFIASELFSHGKYGGFGSLTRTIGREMVKRGVEVYAVVPRRGDQKPREVMDNITVLSYPKINWAMSIKLFRKCDCDIYHSEEPSMATFFAQKAMPNRTHLVTFQDPRDTRDWLIEFAYHTFREKIGFFGYRTFELNPIVKRAVRNATCCFTQARFAAEKAKKLYGIGYTPDFLPNPVTVPDTISKKAEKPTVLFLARWDPRKRIEKFFTLARQFPELSFIALGKATDPRYDRILRERCNGIANIEAPGLIDQFIDKERFDEYLDRSWILCSTSARECLPVSFLEAAAHRCAILSHVDPDCFASSFGYHAAGDDYAEGLRHLLQNGRWQTKGNMGYDYVKKNHEMKNVIDMHIEIYRRHLKQTGRTDP